MKQVLIRLTDRIARAAAQDAADRSMVAHGRESWARPDLIAGCEEYHRLSKLIEASQEIAKPSAGGAS